MTFNELFNSDILKDVLDNPNSLIHPLAAQAAVEA